MPDPKLQTCCCGRKRISETIIINDYQHELPSHGGRFCGPVYKHDLRDLQEENARLKELVLIAWQVFGEEMKPSHREKFQKEVGQIVPKRERSALSTSE